MNKFESALRISIALCAFCLLAIQATGAVRLTCHGDRSQHRAIYGREVIINPHDDLNVISWVPPITRKETSLGISDGYLAWSAHTTGHWHTESGR